MSKKVRAAVEILVDPDDFHKAELMLRQLAHEDSKFMAVIGVRHEKGDSLEFIGTSVTNGQFWVIAYSPELVVYAGVPFRKYTDEENQRYTQQIKELQQKDRDQWAEEFPRLTRLYEESLVVDVWNKLQTFHTDTLPVVKKAAFKL